MSFKAELALGAKKFSIIQTSFTLNRDVDAKGRPSSGVYGGTIQIEVESTEDTSIIEAMVNNQYKAFTGHITFKKSEEDAKMKELKFEDAYIIQYSEGIAVQGQNKREASKNHSGLVHDHPMTLTIVISARKLSMGSAIHTNDWPGIGAS